MRYKFDEFILDPDEHRLSAAGHVVALAPEPFALLVYLVQERERVVSADEIRTVVWHEPDLLEFTFASRVKAVRTAIGDSSERQRRLRAFHPMGYRFMGQVSEDDGTWPAFPDTTPAVLANDYLELPDKPSIAVLSFDTIGGDASQQYFADGIAEEIITALGRMRSLFVIARNSTFAYRGRGVDIRTIGQELGVRYVLTGSVRQADNQVRLLARLVDANTGVAICTQRLDGQSGDLFGLQDQIIEKIAASIEPAIEKNEVERVRRKPAESLGAYDHYLHALAHLDVPTRESTDALLARSLLAIEFDPHFAPAYMLACRAYVTRKAQGFAENPMVDSKNALALMHRGLQADPLDASMLSTAGVCFAWFGHDLKKGLELTDRAITLNPNYAHGFINAGMLRTMSGETRLAIRYFERAARLNPRDPRAYSAGAIHSMACLFEGFQQRAYDIVIQAIDLNQEFVIGWMQLAAVCVALGRLGEARMAAQNLLRINPKFSTRVHRLNWANSEPIRAAQYEEWLRKAGLPE